MKGTNENHNAFADISEHFTFQRIPMTVKKIIVQERAECMAGLSLTIIWRTPHHQSIYLSCQVG